MIHRIIISFGLDGIIRTQGKEERRVRWYTDMGTGSGRSVSEDSRPCPDRTPLLGSPEVTFHSRRRNDKDRRRNSGDTRDTYNFGVVVTDKGPESDTSRSLP